MHLLFLALWIRCARRAGKFYASKAEQLLNLWDVTAEMYNDLCSSLMSFCPTKSDESHAPREGSIDSTVELKLQSLHIPSFSGALHNWLAFKDEFETLVHNRESPTTYKLGKLRQVVSYSSVSLVGGVNFGVYEETFKKTV